MAQKRNAQTRQVPRETARTVERRRWVPPAQSVLLSLLFFLLTCLCSAGTVKVTALVLVGAMLCAAAVRFSVLRARLTPPVLALALYVLMDGVSTLYAAAGKFALYEFLKVLCAFCLALILLALAPGEGERPARAVAGILEGSAAWAGLLSIDMLSTRLLSGGFLALLGLFSQDYEALDAVESGVRMLSLYGNPNVFAGCMGIGVLLSLGLVVGEEEPVERAKHTVLLYINALAFVLAFSMGASASIALGFVVLLLLERERRAGLLVLMLETLLLTVPATALISMTSFQLSQSFQPIPLVCAVLGAAGLCLLDGRLGRRLGDTLMQRSVPLLPVIGGLLALLALYLLGAWNLTGSAALEPGMALRRAVYPDPGVYTLEVDGQGAFDVLVESQNQRETMMHTSTALYSGPPSGVSFTVPEDSLVVYVTFTAQEEAVRLDAARCVGSGDAEKVPLGYYLLPGFIANRIQGLFANENAIQRTVFFDDGLKLFRRSPVIGLGMGAFESAFKSVQTFFYETRYTHNHYIQALVETGVVGLLLFLTLLGVSAAALFSARRAGTGGTLLPALAAVLLFMAAHAVTEVVFSYYAYLPYAYAGFVLIGLACGDRPAGVWSAARVKLLSLIALAVLTAAYAVLLVGNLWARHIVDTEPTLDTLDSAVQLDKFEWADYAVSYVRALASNDVKPSYRSHADAYAQRLGRVNSNIIPYYLADYYFATERTEQAVEMLKKYANFVASDEETWENIFSLFRQYERDDESFRSGVLELAEMLEGWNAENMGEIVLSESAQALIAQAREGQA